MILASHDVDIAFKWGNASTCLLDSDWRFLLVQYTHTHTHWDAPSPVGLQ